MIPIVWSVAHTYCQPEFPAKTFPQILDLFKIWRFLTWHDQCISMNHSPIRSSHGPPPRCEQLIARVGFLNLILPLKQARGVHACLFLEALLHKVGSSGYALGCCSRIHSNILVNVILLVKQCRAMSPRSFNLYSSEMVQISPVLYLFLNHTKPTSPYICMSFAHFHSFSACRLHSPCGSF